MDSLNDIIRNRADNLDLGRGDQLAVAQEVLNELYPGQVRAKRLAGGVLTITTPSAAVASDLRLQQTVILDKLTEQEVAQLKIQIG